MDAFRNTAETSFFSASLSQPFPSPYLDSNNDAAFTEQPCGSESRPSTPVLGSLAEGIAPSLCWSVSLPGVPILGDLAAGIAPACVWTLSPTPEFGDLDVGVAPPPSPSGVATDPSYSGAGSLDTDRYIGIMEGERPTVPLLVVTPPTPPGGQPTLANPVSLGWHYGQTPATMAQAPCSYSLSPEVAQVREAPTQLGLSLKNRPSTPIPVIREPTPTPMDQSDCRRPRRLQRLPRPVYDEKYLYPGWYPRNRRPRKRRRRG
ncbi:hypothetical protein LOZ51_004549 [Ophidiomyces ophidiicola]|nr:hypothetical protein LOZ55_002585 [Ophidiomyces ophidiicola]KAI1980934.1 hypothetical protein LOZ54_005728 [Ophidiomyces ophidiicola]KAI1991959.1 hypothetical protein LOZ51_004549 [Ophidiomyces ophidiicola]